MRKQLLSIAVVCAASLALGVQAQSSSSSSSAPSGTPGSQGESSSLGNSSGSASGWTSRQAGGMMGHEDLPGSQLTGAAILGNSGSELGTIHDVIINPLTGRIDFAVVALSSGGQSSEATSRGTSTSGSSSGTSSSTTENPSGGSSASALGGSSSANGKQVAVPWMLLRPSMTGASATASASQPPQFMFVGDPTKLQSAPAFASSDLGQPSWRQSVFSHFGFSARGTATGGASSPGGVEQSTSPGSTGGSSSDSSGSSSSQPQH